MTWVTIHAPYDSDVFRRGLGLAAIYLGRGGYEMRLPNPSEALHDTEIMNWRMAKVPLAW